MPNYSPYSPEMLKQTQTFPIFLIISALFLRSIWTLDPPVDCGEDEVWIGAPESLAGCYAEVTLDRECHFNLQCSSATSHSYCGFSSHPAHTERNYKVCLCDEGFSHFNGTHAHPNVCEPIRHCSVLSENPTLEKADCGEWQFCRQGVCHCKPDLIWDYYTRKCTLVNGDDPGREPVVCGGNQTYISSPASSSGCYQKVSLGAECRFTGQCTDTQNAFCGWSTGNLLNPTCLCNEGYTAHASTDGHCKPIQTCSVGSTESALEQAECDANMFCKEKLCLCRPDFAFNATSGGCVREEREERDEVADKQPEKEAKWWYFGVIALLGVALVAAIGGAVYLKYFKAPKVRHSPVNEVEMEERETGRALLEAGVPEPPVEPCQAAFTGPTQGVA